MSAIVVKPVRHEKTWGYEDWIANNPVTGYCGKLLVVNPGKRCNFHFHIKKHETFHILQGTIFMYIGEKDGTRQIFRMSKGDTLVVTPGLVHQFENLDPHEDAVILEVSSTHYEEDSYRISR